MTPVRSRGRPRLMPESAERANIMPRVPTNALTRVPARESARVRTNASANVHTGNNRWDAVCDEDTVKELATEVVKRVMRVIGFIICSGGS